jgi:hypothetical protein
MLENGSDKCNCPKIKCERHGNCKPCIEHHLKSLPYCKRGKTKERLLKRRNTENNSFDSGL